MRCYDAYHKIPRCTRIKKDFPSDVNHWARNMEHEKMDVDVQPEIPCMDAE